MEDNQTKVNKKNRVGFTTQFSEAEPPPAHRIEAIFANPIFDKVMALAAILPFLVTAVILLGWSTLDVVRLTIILQWLAFVVTMLARRTPVRVTTNPWLWLLAFVATYWVWLTAAFTAPGKAVVPPWCSDGLAWLGLAIMVYSRISLGRNIGLVPAQRQLVTTGAYGLVRHPIYTGMFVNYLSLPLADYTPGNVVIAGLGILWFIIKSIVEERFLSADPEYAEYMQRVRWRWLPFI